MRKRIISSILCLALVFVIGGGVFFSAFTLTAEAAESTIVHSDVLTDLKKDSSFNEADYPANLSDHSMQVIAVTESDKKELFIYVYHPSNVDKDIKAKKINMSLQHFSDENMNFNLYDLALVSSEKVFSKYQVVGLKVSEEIYRYYSIAGIYRDFDETLGDFHEAGKDDFTEYKGYAVGKSWTTYYYNNILKYECSNMNVLDVQIDAVGFVKYYSGFELFHSRDYVDSHFIAFTIPNYDVEYIYDAEVVYSTEEYSGAGQNSSNLSYSYKNRIEDIEKTLHDYETGSTSGGGLFYKPYSWKRISTSEQFVSEIKDQTNVFSIKNKDVNESQFVFRFLETERYQTNNAMGQSLYVESGVRVFDVGLLRLKFSTSSGTYNLGVVTDLVTDDGRPDFNVTPGDNIRNELEELTENLGDWFDKLIMIVLAIFVIVFIEPITKVLAFIWDSIVSIIEIILKPIKNLFNRRGH